MTGFRVQLPTWHFFTNNQISNMNPLITEVKSSLPCTDLTAKGDDISWVGIVSTKTIRTRPPPPSPPHTHTLLRAALVYYIMRIVHYYHKL